MVAGCSGSSAPTAGNAAPAAGPSARETATRSASDPATSSAGSTPGSAGGATQACALITEQEVRTAIGANPGAGQPFTSHGSSQCQFGSYQSGLVLVNLTPTRGIAGYDLVHNNPKVGQSVHVVDIAGVGDRAFEIKAPHTASIYFDKGDALVLVMVETQKVAPPVTQVLALAKSAAGRI
ncbi:MAG: DUF3558 family protein [Actinomycetota bacterium]|nr:DUF3558 family protein [Actinomycetota bacterium]